jgi:DNA invertase Pin-like site-specific DNA recombinase
LNSRPNLRLCIANLRLRQTPYLGVLETGSSADFIACDQPFANRLTVRILAAVAEDEARRISERTKAALAAAKARGVKLGSPRAKQTITKARAARSAYARNANAGSGAVIADIQSTGVASLTGIAKALQARGIKTPGGSTDWRPVQVARLLAG